MKKSVLARLFLAITAIAMFSSLVIAQETTGNISGTVRDTAGAGVPGAVVTITDADKNTVVRTVTANDAGEYSAPQLQPGNYSITVEGQNFKKLNKTGIKVEVGQRRTVDLELQAGKIEETVTVEADPVAIDLQSATSGTVISGDQVRELSINNRNFTQLVTLAPGVSNDLSDQVYQGTVNPEGQANIVQISVNGARSSQNTFTVDGADITDRGSNLTIQAYPSVDSIGEFRVLRSLFPAESGRSGGGQINVVTKSGGKQFSGSAFEFIRNEAFNANDFITNRNPNNLAATLGRDDNGKIKRRPFRYNNYGWTFGGPVYFFNFGEGGDGGMFRKYDRTFFFFSQELRKDKRFPLLSSTVPSAGLRQGVFTADICLQATGGAGTCTSILPAGTPLANINPVSQQYVTQIFNKLPLPTNISNFQLQFPTENISKFRQEIFKLDHSFNDKVSMYYRFQNDKIPTIDANALFSSGSGLPGVATTSTNSPGRTHTAQLTYAAASNLIFEGRYTYGYGAILSENIGTLALRNSQISSPLAYINQRDRIPTLTFANATWSNLSSFGPYDNFSWKGNISGAVTWIQGNHTFKTGLVYSKYRKNENALAGVNEGQFSGFNTPGGTGIVTPNNPPNTNVSALQQQWANFLLGTNVSFTQASFDYTADLRQKAFEAYGQDEWRVRRNLTLYYGVRYSFFGAPWDKNGRLSNFDPSIWRASAAPLVNGAGARVPGTGNFCNGIIINSQNTGVTFPNCTPTVSPYGKFVIDVAKNDFAPRVGLAWDPFGKGETSVRTGYGMYHEQVLNGFALQNIGTNPPYQQNCVVTGVNIANPVPAGCAVSASNTVANLRAFQVDWDTPYTQHWSLDVQHQLTKNTVVTMGYYGSKGTHLIGSYEENLLAPGAAIARGATGCSPLNSTSTTPSAPCQIAGQIFTSAAQEVILDQIRPYRGYRAITTVETRFNSSYHSMQLFGTHRFSGSSQLNVAYTFAKNLTDNQNDRSASPQNTYNISLDKARAALDRRHILSINYIYELPFFKDQQGFVGKMLGGWQASGIITYNTGLPFTAVTSNYDPAGLGIIAPPTTVARPNVLCDPNIGGAGTFEQFFNTGCFALNSATGVPNTVGNAARGTINGPSTKRVDFTLTKNIKFAERYKIQLRAEAFNIFNTTNFRGLQANVTSAAYGQVITVRDPRVMQFGAKFSF